MDRKQRRSLLKRGKSKYTPEQIELAKLVFLRDQCKGRFKEGDRVKLNMAEIKGSPDWESKVLTYRGWCMEHADNVMTVEYDAAHQDNPSMVCLAEDKTEPKWLFSMIDLMPADGDDGFMDTINWVRASLQNGSRKK